MIAISVVSHGHGEMVERLVESLLSYSEVSKIIVTINTPEKLNLIFSDRIAVIENYSARGFGKNHNEAFLNVNEAYFCVLNPDITMNENPFPDLISSLIKYRAGLAVPLVLNKSGEIDDSIRFFLTPTSLIRRFFFNNEHKYELTKNSPTFAPEWAAGMFMLFTSKVFCDLGGFDDGYYLYCEDIDICVRIWKAKQFMIACPQVQITHDARRSSRQDLKYLKWHLTSMIRYLVKHLGSLPKVPAIHEFSSPKQS